MARYLSTSGRETPSGRRSRRCAVTGAGPATVGCEGCLARLKAVEDELGEIRERLGAIDLEDIERTAHRVRELLVRISELIDEEMTRG